MTFHRGGTDKKWNGPLGSLPSGALMKKEKEKDNQYKLKRPWLSSFA